MKTLALSFAALLLFTATSEAQISAPPTPVVPCDSNAILGSRNAPAFTIATHNDSSSSEPRQTTISISYEYGTARYFVSGSEVLFPQLGRTVAEAWLANSAGASIDQCWNRSAVGEYLVGGRVVSICTIAVRVDDSVRYRDLSSTRNALRDAGFTTLALMRSGQDDGAAIFDYHLPLNPVPILLQGVSPTIVRIMSPPDAAEPVIGIENGREWTATPLTQLGEDLTSAAANNNPALTAEELHAEARICVRPDSIITYADLVRVMTSMRELGFRRVGLYSEAVVPIDEQGRQLQSLTRAATP